MKASAQVRVMLGGLGLDWVDDEILVVEIAGAFRVGSEMESFGELLFCNWDCVVLVDARLLQNSVLLGSKRH